MNKKNINNKLSLIAEIKNKNIKEIYCMESSVPHVNEKYYTAGEFRKIFIKITVAILKLKISKNPGKTSFSLFAVKKEISRFKQEVTLLGEKIRKFHKFITDLQKLTVL